MCDPIEGFDRYEFDKAVAALWETVADLNRQIEATKPWELLKAGRLDQLGEHLHGWLTELHRLAYWLEPLLPGASQKILEILSQSPLKATEPFFPRLTD